MKLHIGWVGLIVVAVLAVWYFNPGGVMCNVKGVFDSARGIKQ